MFCKLWYVCLNSIQVIMVQKIFIFEMNERQFFNVY